MTHQSREQRHGRKCNIKEGNVIKIENATHLSLNFFLNKRLATTLAVLPRDEHSRSLFRNSGLIFLLRYVSVLFLYWTKSHGHHRECYPHRYYFFGFGFLETRSCCPFKYTLVIFECLKFIRNLSHGVRSFVTFIKTYLEYNQLQLQTLDLTEFLYEPM